MMVDDESLRTNLAKIEVEFRDTGGPGERTAAGATMDRLQLSVFDEPRLLASTRLDFRTLAPSCAATSASATCSDPRK